MKISILIAAYHAGKYLPTALAGVAAQTHPEWELVVVEDGSHDDTEAIIGVFAAAHPHARVTYERFNENRGVAAVRNRLLALAQGEMVAFLDADDVWDANHLASLASCLLSGRHALVCTPITLWDMDAGRAMGVHRPTPPQLSEPRRHLFEISFIQTSSCVMLPRESIERAGLFDETLRIGEDRDYWFRVLDGGGTLGCTSSPSCRYTKHSGSSMSRPQRVAEDAVLFFRKHRSAADISQGLARRCLADALRSLGRLTRSENPVAARRAFLHAWKECPLDLDLPLRALTTRL